LIGERRNASLASISFFLSFFLILLHSSFFFISLYRGIRALWARFFAFVIGSQRAVAAERKKRRNEREEENE
jgi:hypothetical protein